MIPMHFQCVWGLGILSGDLTYHYGELFVMRFLGDWPWVLVCISAPFGMNRSRMGAFSVSFSVLGVFSGSDV